jgi:hypothetical protein
MDSPNLGTLVCVVAGYIADDVTAIVPKKTNQDQISFTFDHYGSNQANCSKIDWWKSSTKAIGDQGGTQICTGHWWRQETAPIPPGNGCSPRNPKIPEIDGVVDPQTAVPTIGA